MPDGQRKGVIVCLKLLFVCRRFLDESSADLAQLDRQACG